MNDIKNKTIEEKLREKTADDPIMQSFLLDIVGNEYKTTQYKKFYNDAIDRAMDAQNGGE